MADLSYVFLESNTFVSYTENSENVNISEILVKSPTTNNYIMIKSEDANVVINASSNVSIGSNIEFAANTTTLFYSNVAFNANVSFSGNVILTNTNLAVTSNSFTLGVVNNTANGYSTLPNGLLLQWGTVLANDTVGDVTFSVPFTTSLLSFTGTATTINSAFNYTYTPVVIASNTTTANVRTSNITATNVSWMAIGV